MRKTNRTLAQLAASLGVLVVLVVAVGGHADDAPEGPLLPLPDILRPVAKSGERATTVVGGCASAPLEAAPGSIAFGPGEHLQYDVNFMSFPTGKLVVQTNATTTMDGRKVVPLSAYAKSESLLSFLGTVEGRMLSYVDPVLLQPLRMVNHYQSTSTFGKDLISREDAAFSDDGQVASRLTYWNNGKEKSWPGKVKASTDFVDALSVVYYTRTRELKEGTPFCFELYHRRRLWRVEGKVGGVETVSPPIGKRQARRIDVVARRLSGKKTNTGTERELVVFLSEDKLRLPLIVETTDALSKVGVRLRTFVPGAPVR